MGIDLYCRDLTFGCSYEYWNSIRNDIIKATFDYIDNKIKLDQKLYGKLNENDDNYIGEGSEYYSNINILKNIKSRANNINTLVNLCGIANTNAFNYFELGGLVVLCKQTDYEGYYSPGNSLDICILFDRIESFLLNYECYNSIFIEETLEQNKLYDIFEYSYKTLNKVEIR
jgi:hypothetical protein